MEERITLVGDGPVRCRARLLRTWFGRFRGLLGTNDDAGPVVLVGCSSVHTFGMRYALDVAFFSREGRVLLAWKGIAPGKVVSALGACCAIERPHASSPWFEVGSRVVVETSDEGVARPEMTRRSLA